jgi:hypothetical protein
MKAAMVAALAEKVETRDRTVHREVHLCLLCQLELGGTAC